MAENSKIPNSAFDIEYRTQWRDEVDFLASRGIYYTIRKREGEYNIPVYKYTRTAELFLALADFYLHRLPNRKSEATFKGHKAVQQTFLNDDGTIKKQFDVTKNVVAPEIKHDVIDLDKIKEAKKLLEQAANQVGEEKLKLLTEDDTE